MWLAQTKSTGGQVLGVRETETDEPIEPQSTTSSGFNLNSWVGENILNSGVKPRTNNTSIDLKSINSDLPLRTAAKPAQTAKSVTGKIVLREGFKGNLAVKDFTVGDKVTLKCGDKVIITSVDTAMLSSDNVIAVASDSLFLRLGADPNAIKVLDCVISKI